MRVVGGIGDGEARDLVELLGQEAGAGHAHELSARIFDRLHDRHHGAAMGGILLQIGPVQVAPDLLAVEPLRRRAW